MTNPTPESEPTEPAATPDSPAEPTAAAPAPPPPPAAPTPPPPTPAPQAGAGYPPPGYPPGYSGQAGYGQPGYAQQPAYPAPGYPTPGYAGYPGYPPYDPYAKSRLTAGLLGIFLGGFGVHRFYLGYTTIGVLQILVTIATCGLGSIWGLIEGILIISGSSITTDAEGRPLRE